MGWDDSYCDNSGIVELLLWERTPEELEDAVAVTVAVAVAVAVIVAEVEP